MFAAAMLAASCTTDPIEEGASLPQDSTSEKIVNSAVNAGEGSLLIYVDAESVAALEEGGVAASESAIGDVLKEVGATSIRHAIDMTLNAERKREYGLDRWFVVGFSEDVPVDVAAQKFAKLSAVNRVQYNTLLRKPTSKVVIVDDVAATRSEDNKFDDPLLDMQWHYINTGNQAIFEGAVAGADINAAAAWEVAQGRKEVIVAIVDEGIDYNHPDIKDNMWVNEAELNGEKGVDDDGNGYFDDIYGYNFVPSTGGTITWDKPSVNPNPDVEGDMGHGTHVAGTVAAVNNNGIGVSGVAGGSGCGDGVRLMSCQIFSQGISTTIDTSAAAITYAADMGASVLQNSWGYPAYNINGDKNYRRFYSLEYSAIQYFANTRNCDALDGGIVIFATGNDSKDHADYPAAYVDFIGVTALAPDGLPAYYTNYNTGCNVAAPGGELRLNSTMTAIVEEGGVLSTMPNNKYGYMQGTSMACPHVSGIAALALSYALDLGKQLTLDQLKTILLTSVNDLDSRLASGTRPNPEGGNMTLKNYQGKMGTGAIDAYKVLMGVRGTLCYPAVVGEEVEIDINTIIGDGNLSLTMLKQVEISDSVAEKLGIIDLPAVFGNKAYITPTKPGCGIVTLHAIAGGAELGGGDTAGGMDIAVEVALVVRENNNAQGWL